MENKVWHFIGLLVLFFVGFLFYTSNISMSYYIADELTPFTNTNETITPKNNLSINSTGYILNGTLIRDWSEISGTINTTGNITADYFIGNGSLLTGIPIPNLSTYVPYTGATGDVDLGANDLIVDTDTLFVDATHNKVGIGTTAPEEKFEVDGNIYLNGDNDKIYLGAGKDFSQYYDGTNQNFDLTSGSFVFNRPIKFAGGRLEAGTLNSVIIKENAGNQIFRGLNYGSYWSDTPADSTAFQIGIIGGNSVFTGASSRVTERMMFNTEGFQIAPTYWTYGSKWPVPVGTFEVLDSSNNIDFIVAKDGNVGIGTTTPSEKLEIDGNLFLNGDNDKILLGAGKDASIYYDGTDLNINTQEVGSGDLAVSGGSVEASYKSSDGSAGITQTETGVTDFDITIKDGIITSFTKNN